MTYAWCGYYLDIDLKQRSIRKGSLPESELRETIGGVGLAAQMIYRSVPAGIDPLGRENCLVIAAGVLGGTTWAGSGRLVIAGKSPLTGLWGESSMGGYFATLLKRAGFDAILIREIADEPVILVIDNDKISIEPANDLWGMETYACEEALQSRYPKCEVITIGPAGENLVPIAALVHHKGNNIAARCGLGAVAGSKRLKAIVVRGNKPVPVADKQQFNALKKEAFSRFDTNGFLQVIRRGKGTSCATPIAIETGDLTSRNWAVDIPVWLSRDDVQITGETMQTRFSTTRDTCFACPTACKWTAEIPGNDNQPEVLSGPEYESIAGLGAQPQVNDPLSVIRSADLCNRLGLDTISTGSTIAWALEASEKGLLPPAIIDDDLTLKWQDPQLVLELVRRISSKKPGLGALLGMGSKRAAEIIRNGSEFAIQVKGLELPFHHPRAMRGLEIAYAVAPRGATHNEDGVVPDKKGMTYTQWISKIIDEMDLSSINSSMVYCQFLGGALDSAFTARLLAAATGFDYTEADLLRIGARNWYLRRAFNLREGVGLEQDILPRRIIRQISQSHSPLNDFYQGIAEYHRQRGLDRQGFPSNEKLSMLGLESIIPELNRIKGAKFE